MDVSVVIPTYGRDKVLIDTCRSLLTQTRSTNELILVDQTLKHEDETEEQLWAWSASDSIKWMRLESPSIANAMNIGLREASKTIVLFLDDDIVPGKELINAHIEAHDKYGAAVVAGRVIQPWETRPGGNRRAAEQFDFESRESGFIDEFMGGNFSIRKDVALEIGGIDENFKKVAYRYERDLADRLIVSGHRIYYEPKACIQHLHADVGGIRSFSEQWSNPAHGVGEYYYLLRSPRVDGKLIGFLARPLRSISTRYHRSRPWMIPITLGAEIAAMMWAVALLLKGPRLIQTKPDTQALE